MYEYKAKVDRVIDGDTVDFIVDLGFHVNIKIRCRLERVNTPEKGQSDWAYATETLSKLLAEKGEYVTIKTKKTEKYGRWLVDIDGVNDILSAKWPWEEKHG